MRLFAVFFLSILGAFAQTTGTPAPSAAPTTPPAAAKAPEQFVLATGTKIPLTLKQAISTKQSHEGDAVYAETTFPVVANDRVLVPAGTFVQGRISHIQRGGHIKGRAEVLMHFTTLIYPSGYTVMMPAAVDNAPGLDTANMKGNEGTIRADSQTGQKVETTASTAATGAVVGGLTNGAKGALIGGGIGGAVGTAIGFLTRGNDVKLDAGSTVEMVIQRDIPLDSTKIPQSTRSVAVQ